MAAPTCIAQAALYPSHPLCLLLDCKYIFFYRIWPWLFFFFAPEDSRLGVPPKKEVFLEQAKARNNSKLNVTF